MILIILLTYLCVLVYSGGIIAAAMDRFKDMDYEEESEIYLGDEDSDSDLSEYEDSLSDYLEEQPASSIAAPEEVMTAAAEMTATGITTTVTTTTAAAAATTTTTTTTAAATTTNRAPPYYYYYYYRGF